MTVTHAEVFVLQTQMTFTGQQDKLWINFEWGIIYGNLNSQARGKLLQSPFCFRY